MISISELYHGEYLNALDIAARGDLKVRITTARLVEVYNQEKRETQQKLALGLQGIGRMMVVNTTNARIIAQSLGDDAEKWVGGALEIYAGKAKGKDSIMVRRAWRPAPTAPSAPKAAPAPEPEQAKTTDTDTGEIVTGAVEPMVADYATLKARTPVAKCAILTGQWAAALKDVLPFYGHANHALNTAAKLGHAEITDVNVVLVAAELRVYAEGRDAEQPAA